MNTNASDLPISQAAVWDHIHRASAEMRRRDIDALLLFSRTNLLAFTGVPLEPSDRLVCALLTRDEKIALVCPEFEASATGAMPPEAEVFTWRESDDPYNCLAHAIDCLGLRNARIAADGFTWTAALRRMQAALNGTRWIDDPGILAGVRQIKSPVELEAMRAAGAATGRIYAIIAELLKPGISESELLQEANRRFAALGYTPVGAFFQGGPNAAIPHQPSGSRRFEKGDLVVCDYVAELNGYLSDMTRTFVLGEPSAEARRAYAAVQKAQQAAIAACKPGVTCESVDRVARDIITAEGFGPYFIHRLGHGIGLDVHEPPYLVEGNRQPLEPGICVTVEPGVYVPGRFGIRIEDTIAITPDGCEVLTGAVPTDVSPAFAA